MIARLKINDYEDRADLVAILANAGYRVSVDRVDPAPYTLDAPNYFVIVEEKEAQP